jgi:hypothetical protein
MKCLNCQEETENPKFCCRSCSATYTNKTSPKRIRTRLCAVDGCDHLVKDHRSYFCEEHFYLSIGERKQKVMNSTIGEYRDRIKNSSVNYHASSLHSGIRGLARLWFKDLTNQPCCHCGYSLHVELCHIKAISSFPDEALVSEVNSKDNIVQLCPNCHWEFDNLPRK